MIADQFLPPRQQVGTRVCLGLIAGYQALGSPLVARAGVRCRFEPTCSHYTAATIARDGWVVGGVRGAWRVLRCGPWTPAGTSDAP